MRFSDRALDLSLSWFTAAYRSPSKGSEGSIFLSDGASFDYGLDCGYYYNVHDRDAEKYHSDPNAIRLFSISRRRVGETMTKNEQYLNHDPINQ